MKMLALTLLLIATPALAQDDAQLKRGALLSLQCKGCHAIKTGDAARIGPSLTGVIGAKAAAQPDYAYSPALQASGLVWDAATLDQFLAAPSRTVPGTKMMGAGIVKPEDRAAVIAWLAATAK